MIKKTDRTIGRIFASALILAFSAITANAQIIRGFGAGALILDDNSGHTVTIVAPTITAPGYTLTLPSSLGSPGQTLVIQSNGTLNWQTGSGGGTPSGPAGMDLGGTYPNPTVVSVADVTTGVLSVANGGTGNATGAASAVPFSGVTTGTNGVVLTIGSGGSLGTSGSGTIAATTATNATNAANLSGSNLTGDVTNIADATKINNTSGAGGDIIAALTANGGPITNNTSGTAANATNAVNATNATNAANLSGSNLTGDVTNIADATKINNTSGAGGDIIAALTANGGPITNNTSGTATNAANLSGSNLTGDVTNIADATKINNTSGAGGDIIAALTANGGPITNNTSGTATNAANLSGSNLTGDVTNIADATKINNTSGAGGDIIAALTANGGPITNNTSGTAANATNAVNATNATNAANLSGSNLTGDVTNIADATKINNTSGAGGDIIAALTANGGPITNNTSGTAANATNAVNATNATNAANLSGSNLTGDVTNIADATKINNTSGAGGDIIAALTANGGPITNNTSGTAANATNAVNATNATNATNAANLSGSNLTGDVTNIADATKINNTSGAGGDIIAALTANGGPITNNTSGTAANATNAVNATNATNATNAANLSGSNLTGDVTNIADATKINNTSGAGGDIIAALTANGGPITNNTSGTAANATNAVNATNATNATNAANLSGSNLTGDVTNIADATKINNTSGAGGDIIAALTANGGPITNNTSGTATNAANLSGSNLTGDVTNIADATKINNTSGAGGDIIAALTANGGPITNNTSGTATNATNAANLSGSNLTGDVTNSGDATTIAHAGATGITAGTNIVTAINLSAATGAVDVANGGTGDQSFTAYAPIVGGTGVGSTTTALQSASTGMSTGGNVLTSNGSGALPTWQPVPAGFANPMTTAGDIIYENGSPAPTNLGIGGPGQVLTVVGGFPSWQTPTVSANSVFYDTSGSQATARTGDHLFDVEYPAAGVASAPGAIIKSIGTSGTVTGLTVTATGGTLNNAISALFQPGASSIGMTINGTAPATAGSIGLFSGNTANRADIAGKFEGLSRDLVTGGGFTSTSSATAYSIQIEGSASDNISHSGAAIAVTGIYPSGILVNSTVAGIYGKTSASSVVGVNSQFGNFTGSFGVKGEATATPATAARIVGVWGAADGFLGTNTKSIGVLAQGQGETNVGSTNVALEVSSGELTMGMTSDPNTVDDGVTVVNVDNALSGSEGPSGMVTLTPSGNGFTPTPGPQIQEAYFTVGNEYCSSNSIILATVQNDYDAGNATYTVQVVPGSGSFSLILTQNTLSTSTGGASQYPQVNVGYIIVNPTR